MEIFWLKKNKIKISSPKNETSPMYFIFAIKIET